MADCTCNNFPVYLGKVTFQPNVGIGVDPPGCPLHVVKEHWNGYNEVRFAHPEVGGGASIVFGGAEANDWGVNGWSWSARQNKELHLYRLSAAGGPELKVVILTNGHVGIGMPAPTAEKLVVGGNIAAVDNEGDPYVVIGQNPSTPNSQYGSVRFYPGTRKLRLGYGVVGPDAVFIDGDGNVGIGTTTTPGEKLEVNGNVKVAQNKRLKLGDANLSSGSTPDYHWAHLGVNVWYDGENWQTDDPSRVKGLIQIENGYLSFAVSNTGTPVQWQRRLKVTPEGDVYVNEVKAINSQGQCLYG